MQNEKNAKWSSLIYGRQEKITHSSPIKLYDGLKPMQKEIQVPHLELMRDVNGMSAILLSDRILFWWSKTIRFLLDFF